MIELFFGNNGSVTVQTKDYSHTFQSGKEAAEFYKDLVVNEFDTAGYDGNEKRVKYDSEMVRKGGYKYFTDKDSWPVVFVNSAKEFYDSLADDLEYWTTKRMVDEFGMPDENDYETEGWENRCEWLDSWFAYSAYISQYQKMAVVLNDSEPFAISMESCQKILNGEIYREYLIEKLIDKQWAEGFVCDDLALTEYLYNSEDPREKNAKKVRYHFNKKGVTFTVGNLDQDSPSGEDKWSDLSSDFLEYLIKL